MKSTIFFVVFALFLFFFMGNSSGGYLDQEYRDMDADNDGSISWTEFKFYRKSATPDQFSEIDNNSNDEIEFREWTSYRDKDYPFESKYKNRARDSQYYKRCPRCCYRRCYDFYPRSGFYFLFGHGTGRYPSGHGFHFDDHPYCRY